MSTAGCGSKCLMYTSTEKTPNQTCPCENNCLFLQVVFDAASVYGGIKGQGNESLEMAREKLDQKSPGSRTFHHSQCFPLYSLLLALRNPKVGIKV